MLQRDIAGKIKSLWKICEDDSRMKICPGGLPAARVLCYVRSMKRWHEYERKATKAERRDHANQHGNDRGLGKNPRYRSNREHPDFASEVAKGQELLDNWAASFQNNDRTPRSR